MSDLIDREKTKAAFEPWLNVKGYSEGELNIIRAVLYEITIMPSADALKVVRCKDCKSFSHGYCKFHDAKFVREDGYCYWGERKNG